MPKVYDQQISWQPTGTQKMQYAKIEDFISPALQNVAKAADNARDMMVRIGDKRAASELEQAAKDSSYEIKNWQDFSEPEKTQDKMVAAGMEKYDKVMANLDPATRNRINIYNPKSREIYELKVKEQAADTCYQYAYKTAVADMDTDIGRIINEKAPQGPEAVKAAMDNHLAKMKQTMRPLDAEVYDKSFRADAQKGLIDWYVAYGNIDEAINTVKNDNYAGAIDESTRASYIKALEKIKADGESGSSKTSASNLNLVDVMTGSDMQYKGINGQTPQYAYAVMSELTSAIENKYEPNPDLIARYGNVPLAGGYTYYQLMGMDYTKAVEIIDKSMDAVGKSTMIVKEAREQFVPLSVEWQKITEKDPDDTSKRKLKKGEDATSLKQMYHDFVVRGFDQQISSTKNSDLNNTLMQIGDFIAQEKSARSLAFSLNGQNLSAITNNPWLDLNYNYDVKKAMDVPRTPEQAKKWGDPKQQQLLLNKRAANVQLSGIVNSIAAGNNPILKGMTSPISDTPIVQESKETVKYKEMQKDIRNMYDKNKITKTRYNELNRYLYDLSEGRAQVAFPCLDANTSGYTWNACLESFGFGTVDNSVAYDKKIDRGMHDMSAAIRDASVRKYDDGTVGDVYQVLLSQINLVSKIPDLAQSYGIQNPGVFTGDFMTQILSDLEATHAHELDKMVDLTNNSSLYKEKGDEYDGISWDPVNPSPEVALDITKSKQYQLIGDIEEAISMRLNGDKRFVFDEQQKINMAMNIRRMSSGKRHSVITETDESDREELRNPRFNHVLQKVTKTAK